MEAEWSWPQETQLVSLLHVRRRALSDEFKPIDTRCSKSTINASTLRKAGLQAALQFN